MKKIKTDRLEIAYRDFQLAPGLAEQMIPGNEEAWLSVFLRTADRNKPFPRGAFDEYVKAYKIEGTPSSCANYYRSMRLDSANWKALMGRKFSMPSLVIFGDKDPVIVPEYLDQYETCFDQVDLVRLDGGHFLQEECSDEVASALSKFFEIDTH